MNPDLTSVSSREKQFVSSYIHDRLHPNKVTLLTFNATQKDVKMTQKITDLLQAKAIDYQIIDLAFIDKDERRNICVAIQLDTGYHQLPCIYFGDRHIGGIDDLKAYLSCDNSLKRIIEDSGVITTES